MDFFSPLPFKGFADISGVWQSIYDHFKLSVFRAKKLLADCN